MANIVDKYFNKKKKQVYEYSKLINDLLVYSSNQIWLTNGELWEYLKKTISEYIDKYYFKSMEDFSLYEDYLGALNKCDDRFKTILVCGFNSIPEEKRIGNYKLSGYIISLIVYAAVVLDRFTYPYNHYKINTKSVSSIIIPMLKSVSFVEYKENSKIIKELTSLIKKNDNLESKFYSSLDLINNEESKNIYECSDKDRKYYKVIYKHKIEGLEAYRPRDVEKYYKRIVDDMNTISYELVTTAALKSKMLSKNITFLFPISLEFYEKQSEINKLFKVTHNEGIKDVIKFYISYEDFKNHTSIIRVLANSGFKMATSFEGAGEVPYGVFNEVKVAMVDDIFLEENKNNLEAWKNNGVEFIVKSITDAVSELEMLELKEEK